ncbi:hypothetical protein DFH09DRAFT_1421683 [Mycena vulgaris]|nr:hypothetical protein DFH09DRAFT_1421683 [Mycena vulgaris]
MLQFTRVGGLERFMEGVRRRGPPHRILIRGNGDSRDAADANNPHRAGVLSPSGPSTARAGTHARIPLAKVRQHRTPRRDAACTAGRTPHSPRPRSGGAASLGVPAPSLHQRHRCIRVPPPPPRAYTPATWDDHQPHPDAHRHAPPAPRAVSTREPHTARIHIRRVGKRAALASTLVAFRIRTRHSASSTSPNMPDARQRARVNASASRVHHLLHLPPQMIAAAAARVRSAATTLPVPPLKHIPTAPPRSPPPRCTSAPRPLRGYTKEREEGEGEEWEVHDAGEEWGNGRRWRNEERVGKQEGGSGDGGKGTREWRGRRSAGKGGRREGGPGGGTAARSAGSSSREEERGQRGHGRGERGREGADAGRKGGREGAREALAGKGRGAAARED